MSKSSLVVSLLAASAVLFAPACATIFTSNTETVQMNSDPPGAKYDLGPFSGKTPDSIAIPKKAIPDFATFEMPGYERRTVPVESGIAGVFWINVLFWPGMIVDMVTGDYKTLSLPTISATLTPLAANTAATAALAPATSPVRFATPQAAAVPNPNLGDQWKSEHPQ